jgi:hypothetical protein
MMITFISIIDAIDAHIPHLDMETKQSYQESKKVKQQVKAQ